MVSVPITSLGTREVQSLGRERFQYAAPGDHAVLIERNTLESVVGNHKEPTQEMIEAGLAAYSLFRPGQDSPTMILRAVYLAMAGA